MNGLPPEITAAQQKATTLAGRAGELAAYQPTVGDVLKQKAIDAYGASQDIIKPLDIATQEYLTAPQVGREKYAGIFDPFARERLTAQYTGQQALPMLSLASILGQRFGRIEDIIGAGTRAFQAQTTGAISGAELARQSYQDLLAQYQWQKEMEQEMEIAKLRQAGGGLTPSFWLSLGKALQPSGMEQQRYFNAQSGLTAVTQARQIIGNNPDALKWARFGTLGRLIGGSATQQLQEAQREMVDVITRLRTGAALNVEEQEFYSKYEPKWGTDSPDTIAFKLKRLEDFYTNISQAGEPVDLLQFLSGAGVFGETESGWEVVE